LQFRTSHLENLYEISHETVRAWTIEFSKYLSPTANPGGGKKRLYQKDDLAVFSLVVELRKQGMDFSDIHAALENGQRGEVPDLDAEEIQAIVSSDAETRLSLENERLRQALVVAQDELKKAQKDLEQMQGIRKKIFAYRLN